MSHEPDPAKHLRDPARPRRVRDRIDREYAQPLDVEALARGVHTSAGHLGRLLRRAYGESPNMVRLRERLRGAMTRPRGPRRRRGRHPPRRMEAR